VNFWSSLRHLFNVFEVIAKKKFLKKNFPQKEFENGFFVRQNKRVPSHFLLRKESNFIFKGEISMNNSDEISEYFWGISYFLLGIN